MLRFLRGFGSFWYGFLIGDDWTIAVAVTIGLAATYWLREAQVTAWWLMPLVALGTLTVSVWRALRTSRT